MKKIVYKVLGKTTTEDVEAKVLCGVERPCSEANEEIAKSEAYNGEYTIEDDGAEEPIDRSLENRVENLETETSDLSEALEMILNGVTE